MLACFLTAWQAFVNSIFSEFDQMPRRRLAELNVLSFYKDYPT